MLWLETFPWYRWSNGYRDWSFIPKTNKIKNDANDPMSYMNPSKESYDRK